MFAMFAIQNDGLTFREVVHNLPHDGPALLVYVLVAAFIGFIWHGSRGSGAGGAKSG